MQTWSDYVGAALVTANMDKGHVIEGFTFQAGLCGEAKELKDALVDMFGYPWSPVHGSPGYDEKLGAVIKELGDFLWYTAAMWQWAGFGHMDPMGCVTIEQIGALVRSAYGAALPDFRSACMDAAGVVAELTKKHLGHGKDFDFNQWMAALVECVRTAFRLAEVVGLDVSDVMDANIAKLRARFHGGGFNAELAAAKADEAPPADPRCIA